MANTIILKNSGTPGSAPSAGSLSAGELAVNRADGLVYLKKTDNSVVAVGSNASQITTGTISTSVLPTSGVSAGTYTSVTVDAYGRVTAGSSPVPGSSSQVLYNNNGAIAGSSSMTFDGTRLSVSQLAISSASGRILGDFSNSTISDRTFFQPTATNGSPSVGVLTSGTGTGASLRVHNSPDPTNCSFADILISSTAASVRSNKFGTGSALPLDFVVNDVSRMSIGTDGVVSIGGNTVIHAGNVATSLPYATVAETRTASSEAKVISPARMMETALLTRVVFLGQATLASGGTNSNGATNITHTLASNATPNGSVYIRSQSNPGDGYWSPGSVRGFNWSRRRFGVIRLYMFASSANGVYRFSIGKTTGDVVGPLPRRGIGFEIRAGGAIWISAHNGTALTQINSGISVQYSNIADEYRIESDGNGTVSLFRNDVFINSTTGGPTAFDTSALQVTVSSEITNGGDAANNSIMHTYPVVSIT